MDDIKAKVRRIVRVVMSEELASEVVRSGPRPPIEIDGIPEDANFIGSTFDSQSLTVSLFFQHESFAEVPAGQIVPEFPVVIRRK